MTSAIQSAGLAKSYGLPSLGAGQTIALHPTSLVIPHGSLYALLGHNGAGKTTLLKLLMNILHPSSGSATVLGQPSSSLGADAFTRIGYVSENQELPGWMTVRAFLTYQSGFYPHWDDAALIHRFDLPLNRKLKNLSRGQRMKVALASVLAFQPSLIVLDEPFSGLDPLVRDELIEALLDTAALKAAPAKDGAPPTDPLTILLSSHDLAEIESFCTHVAFLHDGRLLFAEEMPTLSARFREVTVTLALNPSTPPQIGHPNVSTPLQIGHPNVSTAPQIGHPNVSTAPQIGHPNVSTAPQIGHPNVSTAPQIGHPNVSTAPQIGYPEPLGSGLIASPETGFSPWGMPSSTPPAYPTTWLLPKTSGHTFRFVHTQADTEPIADQVRAFFPSATDITLEPMSLRAIFLAIAKSGRTVDSNPSEGSR
jgi:ABC-2 type transport system ATP-binding protein